MATTGGSVDNASETLAPATGVAVGSTATADSGYSFVNWTDSGANEVSTSAYFVPAKVGGLNVAATYTANFTCDPCSGWDATGVTVEKWYAGTSGNSDRRLDIDGTITGPACAGITEIYIEVELYNNGGTLKESFTDTLTSATNTFTVDLDVPSAFYNSITDYMLWITVPGCSSVLMIKEGPVTEG